MKTKIWAVGLVALDQKGNYDHTIESEEFDNYEEAKKRYEFYDSRKEAVELNSYIKVYDENGDWDIEDFGGIEENYIPKNFENIESYEEATSFFEDMDEDFEDVEEIDELKVKYLSKSKNSAVRKAVHDYFNWLKLNNSVITVLDSYYVEDSYGHQQLVEIKYGDKTEYLVGWKGRYAAEAYLTGQNWSYDYNVYDNLKDAEEEFSMHKKIYNEWK